ncbi:hypothetical protein L2E82_50803 [Cichorium intybus]|nr:hypothetical protein L2E82_50803 [Cichorium intybus]
MPIPIPLNISDLEFLWGGRAPVNPPAGSASGSDNVLGWQCKRQLRQGREMEELSLLISDVHLAAVPDRWKWNGGGSDCFSVASVRNLIATSTLWGLQA